ncbi:hypothetical protein [Pseudoxanthomonas sacheonensis]|uniref:Uncharacterized protein n=1 Tax=Pseudoxanthomonas sacheonensis TaxID=443615 RepID=A0ABU1RUB1_9GAMM|nr:hypothetical protein [Pseudoxanthomonas sacheonensis]MDR6842362.1 hypothetical protein [Pseudoxanthomonas sacheonensis]
MLHLLHPIERRFPGNSRALRLTLVAASAALLGIGALLVAQ